MAFLSRVAWRYEQSWCSGWRLKLAGVGTQGQPSSPTPRSTNGQTPADLLHPVSFGCEFCVLLCRLRCRTAAFGLSRANRALQLEHPHNPKVFRCGIHPEGFVLQMVVSRRTLWYPGDIAHPSRRQDRVIRCLPALDLQGNCWSQQHLMSSILYLQEKNNAGQILCWGGKG